MSKLNELIAQLCPNGVEYKTIDELCDVYTGGEAPADCIKGAPKDDIHKYPVYSNGIKDNAIYGYSATYTIDKRAVTFSSIGTIGHPAIREANFTPIIRLKVIIPKDESVVNIGFLRHTLDVVDFVENKSSVANINAKMIKNIKIPVPPLPVQEEIVRILDNFTDLTAELLTNLSQELSARKQQYEYYRDTLLTFGDDVPMVKLGDIATDIYRGAGIKRDQVTADGIPCVRYGEIYTSYDISFTECISHTTEDVVTSPKYFEHGDIIFTITGESVEEIAKSIAYLGHEKCMAGGDTVVMKHSQEPRYISYVLSTKAAQAQKSKGKVKSKVVHSSVPALKEIVIPLPDFETQKRIADLLDNFHKLSNDISVGLPAEIEARQKQYEYYRDKLLSFKAVGQ